MRSTFAVVSVLCCLLHCVSTSAQAAEYFVAKGGDDANAGTSRDSAFVTIQKGVDALEPGDTLTIGPGEYHESVTREGLGDSEHDTRIRAAIPGTVLLRGDVPAPEFQPVDGQRFIYVADFDTAPAQMVSEVDTLTTFAQVPSVAELEFTPGRYYHDVPAGKLYISTSDWNPPSTHQYTVSIIASHGLYLVKPQRVIIEGLAVTGFAQAEQLPWQEGTLSSTWGMFVMQGIDCVVRDCAAYLNGGGGIGLNSLVRRHEGYGGNVIERCVAWANGRQFNQGDNGGLTLYDASNDVIRDSVAFLNDDYGVHLYGGGSESNEAENKSRLVNNITWGNRASGMKIKTGHAYVHEAARNVILGGAAVRNISHNLFDTEFPTEPPSPDNIVLPSEEQLDVDAEFADPHNHDYRLQATSRFRGAAPDGSDRGPYPYEPNVYYVRPDGDDEADGLSIRDAWKTLARAVRDLQPGDTLYLEAGAYPGEAELTVAGTQDQPVAIRGRGSEPVVIHGAVRVNDSSHVSFTRLHFDGQVAATDGEEVTFTNCQFAATGVGLDASGVTGLRVSHCMFTGFRDAAVALDGGGEAYLSGNIYDNQHSPAIRARAAEAVKYTDYNSYRDAGAAWEVAGTPASLEDGPIDGDAHAQEMTPVFETQRGVAVLQNKADFVARGPQGRPIGRYRHAPRQAELRMVQAPVVHSVSATTANIEWTTSLPAECEIAWGTTPACENLDTVQVNQFGSHSLTGLEPGHTYYFRVKSIALPSEIAKDITATVVAPNQKVISFTTRTSDAAPVTYYVAPDGDNSNSGLERQNAWRTVQHAASQVNVGDTVRLAGGTYPERVRLRATGAPDAPITFESITGEKAVMDGADKKLNQAFVATEKSHLRFDGLYLTNYEFLPNKGWELALGGEFNLYGGRDIEITRCFSDGRNTYTARFVTASYVENLRIKNCVATNNMGGALLIWHCPGLLVEHSVFARPLIQSAIIRNEADQKTLMTKCIFTDMLEKKAALNIDLFVADEQIESFRHEDNCYYLRSFPPEERLLLGSRPVSQLKQYIANPLFANPQFLGDESGDDRYGPDTMMMLSRRLDFDSFFATNPQVVQRNIGLQREAFADFHFTDSAGD